MGQALYRKYRPKGLSEIVGQEHIVKALGQAIKAGRISHAYLFTGPRGVGKTSVARILAHEINGLPYTDDSSHLDIIEIDAASNRRIDEIRDLREKVYVAPTSANYKVYIIDEVHMLTKEAFNALLKTLEEPPAHVVFILATTDAHKLPETIISRTQRYSFKPIEKPKMVAHLKHIAKQEKIKVDDDAVELIADHSDGGLRDAESLLDQASNHDSPVTAQTVQTLLGIPPAAALEQLLASLDNGAGASIRLLNDLYEQGYQAAAIAKRLGQSLRQQMIDGKPGLAADIALPLLAKLLEVPVSHDPERYLEIILLGAGGVRTAVTTITQTPKPQPVQPAAQIETPESTPELEPTSKATVKKAPTTTVILDEATWQEVLAALKKTYNTLYGIVRMAHPDFSQPGKITLAFVFPFHQKRINDSRNRQIVADTIESVSGQKLEIICVVNKDLSLQKVKAAAPEAGDSLGAISSIFGGGEVINS